MTATIRSLLHGVHHDERGTSITEFVITLPVFVLSFVAILHLHGISELAAQGKATAYARALDDFKTIQTSYLPFDWSVNAVTAGGRAGIWHNRVSASHDRDRAADLVLDPVPIAAGHMAESYSRILLSGPPSKTAETVGLKPPMAHRTMNALMNTPSKSPITGLERYGTRMSGTAGSVFAKDLNDDLVNISGLSGQKGWMGFMNGIVSTAGARPAFAAGMRYGVTEGEFDEAQTFMRKTWQIQESTHIAAPTRPTSKWISTAIIRSYLSTDVAYNESILAFQMDVNTSDPAAQSATDCQSTLEGINITSVSSLKNAKDVLGDIEGGDPCGTGAAGSGINDIFGFFTGPLSNAASFFGGPVPSSSSSGEVPGGGGFP